MSRADPQVDARPQMIMTTAAPKTGGLPYRPHYQGGGATTTGGRGGTVYKVTTLADSGVGSLRDALCASGPRAVVFEVSGTIALLSPIIVSTPFLTVAGQTAPSPGITVRNHSLYFDTHDVVLQHVRFRLGDTACVNNCDAGGVDVIYIRNDCYNIVLDHLSMSWGTHGGLDVNAWGGALPYNLLVLDCIISENLCKKPNPYATGTIFMPSGGGKPLTWARNLSAHNGNRNPWIANGWQFAGYNNLVYNPTSVEDDAGTLGFMQIMTGYGFGGPGCIVWARNVSKIGLDCHPDGKAVKIDLWPADSIGLTLLDNVGPGHTPENQWGGVTYLQGTEPDVRVDYQTWFATANFTMLPVNEVEAAVLKSAGARPADRDAVDKRVVADVTAGTGCRIESQNDVGGWPALAENRRPINLPADTNKSTPDGRTVLDVWLEAYARVVEKGVPGGVPPGGTPPPGGGGGGTPIPGKCG